MGKHYGLFTDRIEAVTPVRSAAEIQIKLEAKLQQYWLARELAADLPVNYRLFIVGSIVSNAILKTL